MRYGCLGTIGLLAALILAAFVWGNRTGTFSSANFERIRPGMSTADVESLLGGPGVEISESQLPSTVDQGFPVDHPKRSKPVVAGERYLRWEQGGSYMIVSLRGNVVAEKWYWVLSL